MKAARYQELLNTPLTIKNIGTEPCPINVFGYPWQIEKSELGFSINNGEFEKIKPVWDHALSGMINALSKQLEPNSTISFKLLSNDFKQAKHASYMDDVCIIKITNNLYGYSPNNFFDLNIDSTGKSIVPVKVYGNIMSIAGYNYKSIKKIECSSLFYRLFAAYDNLVDASELILPATKLSYDCYSSMFEDCCNLLYPPEVLPAKQLERSCYLGMFKNTGISKIPKIKAFEAKYIQHDYFKCCRDMFDFCMNLDKTEIQKYSSVFIYQNMHMNMFAN